MPTDLQLMVQADEMFAELETVFRETGFAVRNFGDAPDGDNRSHAATGRKLYPSRWKSQLGVTIGEYRFVSVPALGFGSWSWLRANITHEGIVFNFLQTVCHIETKLDLARFIRSMSRTSCDAPLGWIARAVSVRDGEFVVLEAEPILPRIKCCLSRYLPLNVRWLPDNRPTLETKLLTIVGPDLVDKEGNVLWGRSLALAIKDEHTAFRRSFRRVQHRLERTWEVQQAWRRFRARSEQLGLERSRFENLVDLLEAHPGIQRRGLRVQDAQGQDYHYDLFTGKLMLEVSDDISVARVHRAAKLLLPVEDTPEIKTNRQTIIRRKDKQ